MAPDKLTREQVVQLILDLEQDLQTDRWQVDGVHLWPWFRVRIFFYLIKHFEFNDLDDKKEVTKVSPIKTWPNRLKQFFAWYSLGKKKVVFVGAHSHRGNFENVSYNKFFDPIRLSDENLNDTVVIEYSPATPNAIHAEGVISFTEILLLLRFFFKKPAESEVLKNYVKEIEQYLTRRVENSAKISLFQIIVPRWSALVRNAKVWKMILGRIKPRKIFTLCYYNEHAFSLNLAASGLQIPTLEMQHGPISALHLAFGSFEQLKLSSKSPLLPSKFLVWDKSTYNTLRKSFPDKETVIVGHPWIDFLAKKGAAIKKKSKAVLYAMQPLVIGDPFPPFLVRWIKESVNEYVWWFRLHPRQMNERADVEMKARLLLPEGSWELEQASMLPLPIVLGKTDIVVTPISGVAIEAAMLSIPAVAWHSTSAGYYAQEHANRLIYICSQKDRELSWSEFQGKLQSFFVKNDLERVDSRREFKSLMKD